MDRWFDCTQRNYTPVGKYQNLMCQIIDMDNILYTLMFCSGGTPPQMKARCSHKIGGKQFIKKGKIRETSGAYPIHNSMAGSLSNHTVAL